MLNNPSANMYTSKSDAGKQSAVSMTHLALLAAIVIMGAVLRLYDLGTESYWLDEIIMVDVTSSDFETFIVNTEGGRPPLYVLLGHIWIRIFGDSEVGTRSLSAVVGVLSLPLMYLVGRRLWNSSIGLLATLVLSLSIFHIYYSQEYRYYSVVMLCALLTLLFYTRALQTRRISDFLIYAAAAIGVFYSHTFAVFLLVVPGLHFLLYIRRHWSLAWKWLLAEVIIFIGILPGLLIIVRGLTGGPGGGAEGSPSDWITAPGWFAPARTMIDFIFYDWRVLLVWAAVGAAAALLIVGTAVYLLRQGANERRAALGEARRDVRQLFAQHHEMVLLLLWVIVPVIIPFIFSKLDIVGQMYLDRYVSTSAPALALLIAVVLYTIRRVAPLPLTLAVGAVALLPALYQYYALDIKEQWNEAAAYVNANQAEGDFIVIAYSNFPEYSESAQDNFFWYYAGEPSNCRVDMHLNNIAFIDAIRACGADSNRVWIIIHGDNPERMADLDTYLTETHEAGLVDQQRYLGASAYLFELPES